MVLVCVCLNYHLIMSQQVVTELVSENFFSLCVYVCFFSSGQVSLLFAPPSALTWPSAQNVATALLVPIGPHSHKTSQERK